jgi:hypothetical protein
MGWKQPRTGVGVYIPIASSGEGKLDVRGLEELLVRLQQSLLHQ